MVPDANSKHGKYFFSLRVTGEPVTVTEAAKMSKLREEGRLDSAGQKISKTGACTIEKSLGLRMKESGAHVTSVVRNKDKKGEEGAVYKLALTGGQPTLTDATKDSAGEGVSTQ